MKQNNYKHSVKLNNRQVGKEELNEIIDNAVVDEKGNFLVPMGDIELGGKSYKTRMVNIESKRFLREIPDKCLPLLNENTLEVIVDDDEDIHIPASVRSDYSIELFKAKRAIFKQMMLRLLDANMQILRYEQLIKYTPGLTRERFTYYGFDKDFDINTILDYRVAQVQENLLWRIIESDDSKDQKWAYQLLATDEEKKEILNKKLEDKRTANQYVQNNYNFKELMDINKKLDGFMDIDKIIDVEIEKNPKE